MATYTPIEAAQAAIDAHQHTMHLENFNGKATDLWHLVWSLLDWCDHHGVNFDDIVADARDERAANPIRA